MSKSWPNALRRTADTFDNQPVTFGTSDCCQFVRRYAEALTGHDYAADYIYSSMGRAQDILAKAGGLVPLFCELTGKKPTKPAPGAVVVFDLEPDLECAGVLTTYCIVFIHPTRGLCRSTIRDIKAAWRLQ